MIKTLDFRGADNKCVDDKLKELERLDRKPTPEDLFKWKEEAIDRFGLRPYCPI